MSRLGKLTARILRAMMGRHEDAGPIGLRLRAWMMRNVPGQISCGEFERFLLDYHEGSLSPRERRAFELHMELCPMCRVYFESYLMTIELEQGICEIEEASTPMELPDELASAILAARRAR